MLASRSIALRFVLFIWIKFTECFRFLKWRHLLSTMWRPERSLVFELQTCSCTYPQRALKWVHSVQELSRMVCEGINETKVGNKHSELNEDGRLSYWTSKNHFNKYAETIEIFGSPTGIHCGFPQWLCEILNSNFQENQNRNLGQIGRFPTPIAYRNDA